MPSPSAIQLHEIGQIALPVGDLARAVRFYRETLGLPLLFEAPPGLAFFDCAGVRLMLAAPEAGKPISQPPPSDRAMVLYYRVADIERTAAELAAAGVELASAPHRIARLPDHDLWLAFFRDSEGNLAALMSEVRPPAPD